MRWFVDEVHRHFPDLVIVFQNASEWCQRTEPIVHGGALRGKCCDLSDEQQALNRPLHHAVNVISTLAYQSEPGATAAFGGGSQGLVGGCVPGTSNVPTLFKFHPSQLVRCRDIAIAKSHILLYSEGMRSVLETLGKDVPLQGIVERAAAAIFPGRPMPVGDATAAEAAAFLLAKQRDNAKAGAENTYGNVPVLVKFVSDPPGGPPSAPIPKMSTPDSACPTKKMVVRMPGRRTRTYSTGDRSRVIPKLMMLDESGEDGAKMAASLEAEGIPRHADGLFWIVQSDTPGERDIDKKVRDHLHSKFMGPVVAVDRVADGDDGDDDEDN